jgi:hypothetical protein
MSSDNGEETIFLEKLMDGIIAKKVRASSDII